MIYGECPQCGQVVAGELTTAGFHPIGHDCPGTRNPIRLYVSSRSEILTECARLRNAIETHRRNVWGDGPVDNDEDAALYGVLAKIEAQKE